jgi:hypothetical protein
MMACALTRNNPVFNEITDDHVDRTGRANLYLDTLFLEKLHRFHSHAPCKDMRNPADASSRGSFPGS